MVRQSRMLREVTIVPQTGPINGHRFWPLGTRNCFVAALCLLKLMKLESRVVDMVRREDFMVSPSHGTATLIVFREPTTSSASAHFAEHPLGSCHIRPQRHPLCSWDAKLIVE
jgi:hypothetical protein